VLILWQKYFGARKKEVRKSTLNSRITAAALRIGFPVRVFVHGDALRGTRFVDEYARTNGESLRL